MTEPREMTPGECAELLFSIADRYGIGMAESRRLGQAAAHLRRLAQIISVLERVPSGSRTGFIIGDAEYDYKFYAELTVQFKDGGGDEFRQGYGDTPLEALLALAEELKKRV